MESNENYNKPGAAQEAFFNQQKFTDEEADAREKALEEYSWKNAQKAWEEMQKTPSASEDIGVPTENPQLNETPVEHPQMQGYDHSLEMNRWKGKGGTEDPDSAIEMDIVGGETPNRQK